MNKSSSPEGRRLFVSDPLAVVGAVALVLFSAWVIWQLGGFDLMSTVDAGGRAQSIANTFATVDHPFHTARAQTLLDSLREGQPLRWIANHQGGYPVEFYPLGTAWLDVGLWALLMGAFPIIAVHKLAVLIIFVLPALGFWILARGDRLSPFVPILALAIQVTQVGFWTNGGYLELVVWGLVANVGGATLAFVALAALARFVLEGNRWYAVIAMLGSSAALYTNTRSGIAVVVAAVAVLAGVAIRRDPEREVPIAVAVRRLVLVGIVSMLLTAPLLFSMARYGDLYYFVHYMDYENFRAFWDNTEDSVSRLFVLVAIVGMALALIVRGLPVMRIVAVSTLLYGGLTVLLSFGDINQGVIQQLETPRLMPFQRLLVIYLTAGAVGWLLDRLAGLLLPRWRQPVTASLLIVGAVITLASYDGALGEIPVVDRTSPTPTTGVLESSQFAEIVASADALVPEGTAIYVVGDQESWWHEQLWAPAHSEAPFFYDDWMWYWHPDFDAPYDKAEGHFIPNPAQTFTQEWLQANGIGALVVTNMPVPAGGQDPRHAAADNPNLEFQQTIGYWDLYQVRDPGSIVTNGDTQPTSLTIENERIMATFDAASGDVYVRRNWFPRWEAYADGQQIDVERTDNGYMRLDVPEGTHEVELIYAVTWLDWLGRIAAVLGLALVVIVGLGLRKGRLRRPVDHAGV